ncbi:MAG: hypothetical protein KDA59_26135 [Planctomycetales bacterium]|nr:hypothetical protein [Planctomycetales bacterium]
MMKVKRNGISKCGRGLAILLAVATAWPVWAQELVDESPITNRAEIVEIEDAVARFQETADAFGAARQALGQPHPVFTKFTDAMKRFRANPQDPQAAGEYAEAFAESVQVMINRHDEVLALREQVRQDFEAFQSVVSTRRDALERQRTRHEEAATAHRVEVSDTESKLDEVAQQYETALVAGERLPEEMARWIEKADLQVSQAKTKEALFRSFAERAAKKVTQANESLAQSKSWLSRVELHLLNAEGNRETLELIAGEGRDALTPAFPKFDLARLQLDPIDLPPNLGELLDDVNRTNETEKTAGKVGDHDSAPTDLAARRILERRLPKKSKAGLTPVAANVVQP